MTRTTALWCPLGPPTFLPTPPTPAPASREDEALHAAPPGWVCPGSGAPQAGGSPGLGGGVRLWGFLWDVSGMGATVFPFVVAEPRKDSTRNFLKQALFAR